MQITKRYQLGIISFIISVAFSIFAAYVYGAFSGAMCAALGLPAASAACAFFIYGMIKTFHEQDFIDTHKLDTPIKLKFKSGLLWLLILILVGFYAFKPAKPIISMYNTNISYVNEYDKVQQARKMFYDKMWKTYLTKNQICELNRETFIEVTSIIMQGRSDGQNVSWKIVHENQPIPYDKFSTFYADLSNFVTSQREEYYKLENQAMGIVQKQNSMLDSFPNNMYNRVLGIEKLKYTPGFTSTKTEQVFNSHREDL